MSELVVVGGLYHEACVWPNWDQLFGSGGRAAVAASGHADTIIFRTYAPPATSAAFQQIADLYGVRLDCSQSEVTPSFDYVHSLSIPIIRPNFGRIPSQAALSVDGAAVLRFGMLEGTARVDAEWCVYDPQSAFRVEPFLENGSRAKHLAIVANRSELMMLAPGGNPRDVAQSLLSEGVEVVVMKAGSSGATVFAHSGESHVTPFQSSSVWTIGSGDVFASMFAIRWAVNHDDPVLAAEYASRAVSRYAATMGLPMPSTETLKTQPAVAATITPQEVYLAGPFFSMAQRWLIDEARRGLKELGVRVFSPVHDIGPGPAHVVGPADLEALDRCDSVFAIVDGLDSGTLFEIGYARAHNKPVYALAQSTATEDLKMVEGSGCKIHSDFCTALHHLVWRV